jgi:hypothetical protein
MNVILDKLELKIPPLSFPYIRRISEEELDSSSVKYKYNAFRLMSISEGVFVFNHRGIKKKT